MPADDSARPTPHPRWRVRTLAETPSTNAYVAEQARAGERPGLVVATGHQTAGRGRLGRSWVTPAGVALTFSVLVAPWAVPVGRWPWLPLLTGLAVVEGVRTATGVDATLKWPNDVLVGDRKVCGVLLELVEAPSGLAAVVGVGLNVSATREQLPVATATSLALEGAVSLDHAALLEAVLARFAVRFDAWSAAEGAGVRTAYVDACSTLGRRVRVELPAGGAVVGDAVDVDDDGRLRVDDGTRVHALGAGDVVHVRPSGRVS